MKQCVPMKIQSLGDKYPPRANSKQRDGANENCHTFSLEGALKHYHSFYDSIETKIMTQFLFEIELMES